MMYFHRRQYHQIQEQIISFPRKNQGVARFQKQMLLNLHQNNFLFSKCKIKIHSGQLFLYQAENGRDEKIVA